MEIDLYHTLTANSDITELSLQYIERGIKIETGATKIRSWLLQQESENKDGWFLLVVEDSGFGAELRGKT